MGYPPYLNAASYTATTSSGGMLDWTLWIWVKTKVSGAGLQGERSKCASA